MKKLLAVAAFALLAANLAAPTAAAQSTVAQGAGNSATTPWTVDPAAVSTSQMTIVCVPTAVTTITVAAPLSKRRFVTIQNQGSNFIACGQDPAALSAAGAGYRIPANDERTFYFGPKIPLYCIANTALQTAPNCTTVLEAK